MKDLYVLAIMSLMLLVGAGLVIAADDAVPEEQSMTVGPPPEMEQVAGLVGDWHYKGQMRMDPNSEWMAHEAEVTSVSYTHLTLPTN